MRFNRFAFKENAPMLYVRVPKLGSADHWRAVTTTQWIREDMTKKSRTCSRVCKLSQIITTMVRNYEDFATFCNRASWLLHHLQIHNQIVAYNDSRIPRV